MTNPNYKLLGKGYVNSAVDHRGFPAEKSSTGGWRSAWFIIGVEVAERFAYFGIGANLMNYLTGPLGESTAAAAANVNAWVGTGSLLPIFGAFVADAYLGRYRTILVASLVYAMGMALLTLSAFLNPIIAFKEENSHNPLTSTSSSSLAFGADQFDGEDPEEKRARSSFFNWWYLSLSAGINLAILVIVYVQDNVGWALGYAIPCVAMTLSLMVFVYGKRTYRFARKRHDEENAFSRVGRVFYLAFKNRRLSFNHSELEAGSSQRGSDRTEFLQKALLSPDASVEPCSVRDVEDATALIRLLPIWLTTLTYAVPYAQFTTFFTKQGVTMNRQILCGVVIPPASLQILIGLSIIFLIPIYDRVFVPMIRSITKEPSGITMLQRIGAGMVLSALTMVISALVESKRLETAKEYGLIDEPNATVPMSIWWLVPQYLMLGLADVFTLIGMQEFFYSQVPEELRSIGLALYSSVLGVGSFLSSILISAIDSATRGGKEEWFNSNLNKAHLQYFYWLLATLSALGFIAFSFSSRSHVYT